MTVARMYPEGWAALTDPSRTSAVTCSLMLFSTAPTFDAADATVSAVGGTESTATGYARQALTGFAASVVSGQVALAFDDAEFAITQSGQTIAAGLIYLDGASDSERVPLALLGGQVLVTCAADAASSGTTVWVEALRAACPSGTALAFTNGTTGTLSADGSAGVRSVSVTALAGAILAGETATFTPDGDYLPITTTGDTVTVGLSALSGVIGG